MLVSSSGQWVGGISGGCLEGDALKRSQKAIFSKQPSVVVYDTLDDDDNQIGVGLGCNGRIEVLFSPIDPNDAKNPIEQLRIMEQAKGPSIVLKVVDCPDALNLLGQSKIITSDSKLDDYWGIDAHKIQSTISEVEVKKRPIVRLFTTATNAKLNILIEYIRPETKLVIVGDNYDVSALVGIACELGWECHIVGRRKKISKTTFQLAKAVYEYESFSDLELDEYTAVILMTHDYNWDKKILPQVIDKEIPYIGMLGPKKRLHKMERDLDLKDLDQLHHFYSPVGLDIGAESPEEIALAIAAEIVAAFRSKKGSPLKFKKGVIHE